MATAKTTTLTFCIDPNIKEALCVAADRDHRSIANMVPVMRSGLKLTRKPGRR